MDRELERLQRTLDMLILKAVSLEPLHGYGVLLRIQQISKDRLEIQQGSLYPALYRLEHQGWITSEWGESENKRKKKYYRPRRRASASCRRKRELESPGGSYLRESLELVRRKYEAVESFAVVVERGDASVADGKRDGYRVALSHRGVHRGFSA